MLYYLCPAFASLCCHTIVQFRLPEPVTNYKRASLLTNNEYNNNNDNNDCGKSYMCVYMYMHRL